MAEGPVEFEGYGSKGSDRAAAHGTKVGYGRQQHDVQQQRPADSDRCGCLAATSRAAMWYQREGAIVPRWRPRAIPTCPPTVTCPLCNSPRAIACTRRLHYCNCPSRPFVAATAAALCSHVHGAKGAP